MTNHIKNIEIILYVDHQEKSTQFYQKNIPKGSGTLGARNDSVYNIEKFNNRTDTEQRFCENLIRQNTAYRQWNWYFTM